MAVGRLGVGIYEGMYASLGELMTYFKTVFYLVLRNFFVLDTFLVGRSSLFLRTTRVQG